MLERPMSYTWNTADPKGRAWITARPDRADRPWTPPPPLPTTPTGPPVLTWGQRLALPGRWPVQPPDGLPPLPQHAHVLKELESEAVLDLFAEAGRLRRFLLLSAATEPGSQALAGPDRGSHLAALAG
jgi:hypothetical protein